MWSTAASCCTPCLWRRRSPPSRPPLRCSGRPVILVECRSINDPMARLGEVISPTERIYGHYRRFIITEDELIERVQHAGLAIEGEVIESDGLAVYKDDNPVVIRLAAIKPA